MNYKEKLIKQAEYYETKRRAILDTIRSLEITKDDSEPINWDEVNNDKVQPGTVAEEQQKLDIAFVENDLPMLLNLYGNKLIVVRKLCSRLKFLGEKVSNRSL